MRTRPSTSQSEREKPLCPIRSKLRRPHLQKLPLALVWFLIILYILTFATLSISRYESFKPYVLDMGNYDQALWNTLHGRLLHFTGQPEMGRVRLGMHVEPILIPLSLLYLVYSDPRTLLVFQAVVIALGALPVFWLAREKLRNDLAAIVFAAAYLLFPPLEAANMFDFHAVSLTPTLFLCAFYFMHKRNYRLFALFALLAASCKEEISLIVAMMGLYIFLIQRNRKEGLLTILAGAIWFYVAVYVVIPHFHPEETSPFLNYYEDLGDNPLQIAISLLTRPGFTSEILLTRQNLVYLYELLRPFAFLSLFAPQALLLALPSLAINLLSNNASMHRLALQYPAPIIPFVVISSIYGAERLRRMANWDLGLCRELVERSGHWPVGLVLLCSLISHRYHGLSPLAAHFQAYTVTAHHRLAQRFIDMIPKDAAVSAQLNLGPRLTQREKAYLFPHVEDAEYLFLDAASLPNTDNVHRWIQQYWLQESEFGLVAAQDGYLLLRRGLPSSPLSDPFYSFVRVKDPCIQYPMVVNFGEALQFLGFDILYRENEVIKEVHFNLYWRALRELDDDYFIALYLVDSEGQVVGSTIQPQPVTVWYPTSQWKPDETVRILADTLAWWTGDMAEFSVALGVLNGDDTWDPGARLRPQVVEADLVTEMPSDGTLLQLMTFHNDALYRKRPIEKKRIFTRPSAQHILQADLGHQVRLLGYDLSSTNLETGGTLHLILYWQALTRMDRSYTVFTHLLDAQNKVWGQKDNVPMNGTYPTTVWLAGEVIVDPYDISIHPDAPSGRYLIEIGLYDAETGRRLGVSGGPAEGDRILLGEVELLSAGAQ